MKLLFTNRKKSVFSRLIKWGTNSEVSHVAIEFDNGIIIHSTGMGVDLDYKTYFYNKNNVIYYTEVEHPQENRLMHELFSDFEGKTYDFGAVLYLFMFFLIKKVFNYEISTKNRWAKSNFYMCTELAKEILPFDLDYTMTTPEDLLTYLGALGWEINSL